MKKIVLDMADYADTFKMVFAIRFTLLDQWDWMQRSGANPRTMDLLGNGPLLEHLVSRSLPDRYSQFWNYLGEIGRIGVFLNTSFPFNVMYTTSDLGCCTLVVPNTRIDYFKWMQERIRFEMSRQSSRPRYGWDMPFAGQHLSGFDGREGF